MRRWGVWGAAILVAGVLGHATTWWAVTERVLGGIGPFVQAAALAGWRLEGGPARRASWPSISVVIPGARAAGHGVRWEAETVRLSVPLMAPGSLRIEPSGAQSVQAEGAAPVPFRAERLEVRAALDGMGPGEAEAERITGAGWGVQRADLRWDGPAVTASATGVRGTDTEGALAGGRARLVATPGWPAEDLAAWQRAGGRVLVEGAGAWGAAAATLEGEAALDARLEPVGRGRLAIERPGPAVDALVAAGAIGPGAATAMRGVIGLLAPTGGAVTVPVTVADGRLNVSGFGVARLPWSR